MKKLIKNIYRLLAISTPFYIVLSYLKNFLPNYRKKNECNKIEKNIYSTFKSINHNEKWFCNNLFFLNKNLSSYNLNKLLEIGSYEGRSAIFFSYIFKNSQICCVDTWIGSDEHNKNNFNIIENNFDINTKFLVDNKRLKKVKTTSDIFFHENDENFDFIYVDGDHSKDQVLKDLENSWKYLNKNGFLLIDDYMWWYYNDLNKNPAAAVNIFINNHKNEISSIVVWHQVLIRKK